MTLQQKNNLPTTIQEQLMLWRSKMFKSQHQQWLESQPKWTREWIKRQAVWHDSDLWLFFAFGAGFGLIAGFLLGLSL